MSGIIIARAAWRDGRTSAAVEAFESLVADDPSNPEALIGLALLRASANRVGEASDLYQRALTLGADPDLIKSFPLSPVWVQFETIRACNAKCIMCPLTESPTQHRVMSEPLFRSLADQVLAMRPIPTVGLYGLALQLPFCFEVGALSVGLVRPAPE